MIIDSSFCRRKILDVYGPAGETWLSNLPGRVADCAQRWSLEVLPPFPSESFSYVAPAVRADGMAVVLKVGMPCRELICQAEALRWWSGSGAVRLLDAVVEQGILLMERVVPGTSLELIGDDEQVTRIEAEVMRGLWKPAPEQHPFDTVAGWAKDLEKIRARFNGGYGPFIPYLVDRAAGLFADLLQDSESMPIHGDMNSGNILQYGQNSWRVIDPKGVVGDPLYDVATFLNYLPEDRSMNDLRKILDRRVGQMVEILGFTRQKVLDWGQAHAVLAGYWKFEDHGAGWEWPFSVAELYQQV